jgi:RNA 2',3'-cyclic 3'-phosphodiesterase
MARIRTFIAVELAGPVRDRLKALQEKLGREGPGVRWTPTANMHLTLLFLGEVEQLDVVKICRTVRARAGKHEPFTLDVDGVGAFPNVRRPKILWAGITEGVEPLRALHADLEEGLLDLGCYRREEREYTPHLTLGRLTQESQPDSWGPILAKHADWQGGTTDVDEVLVMASDLRRDGPQYSVMGRAALAGVPDRSAKADED